MLKRLAVLALFSAVLFGRPCVAQHQQTKPHTQQSESDGGRKNVPLPAIPVQTKQANTNPDPTQTDPPEKPLPRFIRPEWIVVYITAIYVCISLGILRIMKRQTGLQSAAMQQWVDVETRGVEVSASWEKPFGLQLQFEVVNNTPYLLTIQKIVTTVALWPEECETFTVCPGDRLPPCREGKSSGHSFYVETGIATKEEFEKRTVFTISGEVTFKDCLEVTRIQPFGGLYECSPGHFEYLKPIGIAPESEMWRSERRAKQVEREKNPN